MSVRSYAVVWLLLFFWSADLGLFLFPDDFDLLCPRFVIAVDQKITPPPGECEFWTPVRGEREDCGSVYHARSARKTKAKKEIVNSFE